MALDNKQNNSNHLGQVHKLFMAIFQFGSLVVNHTAYLFSACPKWD